eukprot:gene715-8967_t
MKKILSSQKQFTRNLNVLITGATGGIGETTCVELSKKGHNVIIFGREEQKIDKLIQRLNKSKENQKHFGITCDITNLKEIQEKIRIVESHYKNINHLINCAGTNHDSLLLSIKEKDIEEMINVNLMGTILMTKCVIKNMLKQKENESKSVINIGSIVGEIGNSGQSIYSATKSGLIGFTKSLSKELGCRNIRVNLIQPGFIETEMTNSIKNREEVLTKISLKKFGNTKNISSAIDFCIENDYLTGQVLTIDGGLNL